MAEHRGLNARLAVGIILIVLGMIFLMENYGWFYLDFPFELFQWQTILILIGVILMAASKNYHVGIILITIGLIGFFPEFWPLILVGIGFYIIYKRKGHPVTEIKEDGEEGEVKSEDDYINDVAIFGGGNKVFQSKSFRGGKVTAIFGGSEIDLLDCQLAEGTQVIDVLAIFGGSSFVVPREWKVELDVVPLFGGFSDDRRTDPNRDYDDSKRLVIKGLVLFGGGEVKN